MLEGLRDYSFNPFLSKMEDLLCQIRICILSELCLLKQTLDNMSWFRRIRYHKYIKIVDKMLQIYKNYAIMIS